MSEQKVFIWDEVKNAKLKSERSISFEEVVYAIESGRLMDTIQHPNSSKYQNQCLYLVLINAYIYVVPFIEEDRHIILKTVFPSRKETKKYLEGGLS